MTEQQTGKRAALMEFEAWPKIPRLHKQVSITEKIDGTNGAIVIRTLEKGQSVGTHLGVSVDDQSYVVGVQSRNRFITPGADNHGFAAWAWSNAHYLVETLGVGRHYGEWWGSGINRGYGMKEKHFSLFNAYRWEEMVFEHNQLDCVPVIYKGEYNTWCEGYALNELRQYGSFAAPGFDRPEGIVIHHRDADQAFKVLLENDDTPKSGIERLREATKPAVGGRPPLVMGYA